ncbi:hypothetical protein [Intrasporangium calvum]|uniref:hypothetical protein n=1 Tax=Intrasporangium calvum TaxID=53358 RepID=UPI000DF61F9D|nr:hypothetical protein [Intrasporangium calvum]AXG12513.1 hypothetical protein DN585_02870 [Intrasporangium calvum]
MMTATARTCRLPAAVLTTSVLVVALALTTGRSLDVGSEIPVRAHWFLLLGMAVVIGLPLYPSFGSLDRTLARARTLRLVRWVCHAVLVAGASAIALTAAATGAVTWFLLLATVGVLCAVVTTDKAWLVVILVGGATVLWEHLALSSPVSSVARDIGLTGAGAAFLGSGVLFVLIPGRHDPEV